jgi:hypothetical protein
VSALVLRALIYHAVDYFCVSPHAQSHRLPLIHCSPPDIDSNTVAPPFDREEQRHPDDRP